MLDDTYLSTLKNDDEVANAAAKKVRLYRTLLLVLRFGPIPVHLLIVFLDHAAFHGKWADLARVPLPPLFVRIMPWSRTMLFDMMDMTLFQLWWLPISWSLGVPSPLRQSVILCRTCTVVQNIIALKRQFRIHFFQHLQIALLFTTGSPLHRLSPPALVFLRCMPLLTRERPQKRAPTDPSTANRATTKPWRGAAFVIRAFFKEAVICNTWLFTMGWIDWTPPSFFFCLVQPWLPPAYFSKRPRIMRNLPVCLSAHGMCWRRLYVESLPHSAVREAEFRLSRREYNRLTWSALWWWCCCWCCWKWGGCKIRLGGGASNLCCCESLET